MAENAQNGFTLIELLMVVSMLVIVTGIILVSNRGTRHSVVLANAAHEVSVLVKEAQTYGIFGRGRSGTVFGVGYGVHIDRTDTSHFTLFADIDNDGLFDTGESERVYALPQSITIADVCGKLPLGTEECSSGDVVGIDIVFKRPGPDPTIKRFPSGTVYSETNIHLTSGGQAGRTVRVTESGQTIILNEE